ncbi:unnamed protein product [Thlaspi arvense]|uniref:Oxysterol-binding protein n=1 Tax=Thlaspi arvense TaxID=13288 RepID=A0AAU9S3E5_THLAR|nr:unnamed protein product [Thlaspi arvense]
MEESYDNKHVELNVHSDLGTSEMMEGSIATQLQSQPLVVMTPPLKLESESDSSQDYYKVPNLLQRILSLLKNIHPGADLTHFPHRRHAATMHCQVLSSHEKVPPTFNIPKSMLQCYGESVYCTGKDLLSECAKGKSPMERFIGVVAWSISTTRPLMFGVSPYNPILGETHHVSRGSLNVLLEQGHQLKLGFCRCRGFTGWAPFIAQKPPLQLTCVLEGVLLLFVITIGPSKAKSFQLRPPPLPTRAYFKTVTIKDVNNGKETVIYDAKEVLSGLKTPVLKESEKVWTSESAAVWQREAKTAVEERERELVRARKTKGETWVPKHFTLSSTKEAGLEWDCVPNQQWVPPAPIFVPI